MTSIELYIDDKCSFQFAQYEFSRHYPFLKIDFLRSCPGEKCLEKGQRMAGAIPIDGHRTVGEVVKDFEDLFGLSMVMHRRSAGVWIETTLTTDWTLEQQNREGESIDRIGIFPTA